MSSEQQLGQGENYLNQENFSQSNERIVIFSASLTIAVKRADSLNRQLTELTKRQAGYAIQLGSKLSTIRVPANKLTQTLEEIQRLGKVSNKRLSGNDVTEEYTDYQMRLENSNKARHRYLELLSKAENVEAALKVEKELERVNGEIELLKGKLEKLKHLSEYSTIQIDIVEKKKLGVVGAVGYGLFVAVKWLFVRN